MMDSSEDLPTVGDGDVVAAVTVAKEDVLNQDEAEIVPPLETRKEMEQKREDDDQPMSTTAVSAEAKEPLKVEATTTTPPQCEAPALTFDTSTSIRNHPKKRTRRVGKIPVAKVSRLEEDTSASGSACIPDVDVEDAVVIDSAGVDPPKEEDAMEGVALEQPPPSVVSTKHDEKWNERFDKLLEYKAKHGNTMVPQCYQDDTRLGRWVHYQRVEYWLHQETGHAKITKERIARLDAIGFEWDPQKAIWNIMYDKLKAVRLTVKGSRSKIDLPL
jgi:hypothetical protein